VKPHGRAQTRGCQCTCGGIGTSTSLQIHKETIRVIQNSKNITRNMESAWHRYQHLETALRYTAHLSLNKTLRRDIRVQKARNKRAQVGRHTAMSWSQKKSSTSYYCPPSSSHAARNVLESVITQLFPSWIFQDLEERIPNVYRHPHVSVVFNFVSHLTQNQSGVLLSQMYIN
jgi:hypothetical protein